MSIRETRLIRSATLQGYAEAAASVGLDPKAILARVGLSLDCLDDSDTMISFDAWLETLAVSASVAKCEDFGTRAAVARGIPDYGPVSLLMREAATVGEAIQYYTSHLPLHSDGTIIHLDTRSGSPFIAMEIVGRTREQSIQAIQYCVAGVIMQIRWLTGAQFQPEMISFSHSRRTAYRGGRTFFDCPVSYNQVLSGIVVREEDLRRANRASPPFLRKQAIKFLEPLLRTPNDFAARVRRSVRELLPEGECTAAAVARRFGIDRRTLNRRLEHEGEAFSTVLQAERAAAALRNIERSDCTLTDLAGLTGFESLSSFSRWFHQTFQCTATEWRTRPASSPKSLDAIARGRHSAYHSARRDVFR